jgi:putative two-component system response regulator
MKELLVGDRADVLVLDDQTENLHLLVGLLAPEFTVHPFSDSAAMLRYLALGRPADLIMLDVVMPPPDGHEICRRLRAMPDLEDVPIIFITALDNPDDEARGLALGAVDYVGKPFSAPIVLTRVRNHVRLGRAVRLIRSQNDQLDQRVAERTAELARKNKLLQEAMQRIDQTQDATIVALSSLAEMRDPETGHHILRTQNYLRELAREVRRANPRLAGELDDEAINLLYKSAPLHDIGKVAIPDHILLKPGKLEAAEFEVMKTHAEVGRNALEMAEATLEGASTFLSRAREIAYGHHERWDGSGYPQGLRGEAIPLSARLMAVADVYDALISKRVYKPGYTHAKAVEMICAERGRHFDPVVVDAFVAIQDRFAEISSQIKSGFTTFGAL